MSIYYMCYIYVYIYMCVFLQLPLSGLCSIHKAHRCAHGFFKCLEASHWARCVQLLETIDSKRLRPDAPRLEAFRHPRCSEI